MHRTRHALAPTVKHARRAQVNGVLQKNPAYQGGGPALPQNIAAPSRALMAVCTVDDIAAQNASGGAQIQMSDATQIALEVMQVGPGLARRVCVLPPARCRVVRCVARVASSWMVGVVRWGERSGARGCVHAPMLFSRMRLFVRAPTHRASVREWAVHARAGAGRRTRAR
jgi:hypothetical protein